MAIGTCKFCRQVAGRGSYAFVRLEVTPDDEARGVDIANVASIPHDFVASAVAGIYFAQDQFLRQGNEPKRNRVRIAEIKYSNVDSSSIMFVYAGAQAFCDALGLKLEIPIKVDPDDHKRFFCFSF